MKILIMMTGGTISTTVNSDGNLRADGKNTVSLLARHYMKHRCPEGFLPEFEYAHPLDILSENMTFGRLNTLIEAFKKLDFKRYDGIIVAHGTDTLAYTSTLLSLILAGEWDKPIFIVSADKTLSDSATNGYDNFAAACELIKDGFGAGVYVPYRNTDGVVYLHHGARLRQCGCFSSDFYSDGMVPYTEAKPYRISVEHSMLRMIGRLSDCILRIDPYVGLDYSVYSLGSRIRGILHTGYHSSTACVEHTNEDEPFSSRSVLYLLSKCKKQGIDLYISPLTRQMQSVTGIYSTTAELIKKGVIPVYSLTNEAAYMKLVLAYSLGYEGFEVECFIHRDVCGELIN